MGLLEESLALARVSGSSWVICDALASLSFVAEIRDDLGRAETLAEESLTLAREMGDILTATAVNNTLAMMACRQVHHG